MRRTGQTDRQAGWLALFKSGTDAVQSLQTRHSSRISQGFIYIVVRYDFSLPCKSLTSRALDLKLTEVNSTYYIFL